MSDPGTETSRQATNVPGDTARLSVVLITLNEEHTLARCLSRLDFASEIIVADTGSTDGTLEVARRFTRHVVSVPWLGFGPTKQSALQYATGRWVLSLDADEVVDEVLAVAIRDAVQRDDPQVAAYRLNRRSNFLGTWMKHSGWYPDRIVRLGRRESLRFSDHPVHEHLQVTGRVLDLPGHLLHFTDPDWPHYLAKLRRYSQESARRLHREGRRAHAFDLVVRPVYQLLRTYLFQAGFLDGRAGWLLACGSAFHVFSKYAHLWDLEQRQSGVHPHG